MVVVSEGEARCAERDAAGFMSLSASSLAETPKEHFFHTAPVSYW